MSTIIETRLREKLRNFAEQYEIREKHFETTVKAKDLELQLLEAKVKQQTHLAAQEAFKVFYLFFMELIHV